jgi:hypothetical protein
MHGYCYTMNEEHGLVKVDLKKQMTVIDEIWRIV